MRKLVKTLFNYRDKVLVSVRDYEVEECIKKNDVMHIVFGDEIMTLDPHSLKTKVVLTSDTMSSKTGGKGYKLISFEWNPNINYDD